MPDWQPTASKEHLKKRAEYMARIRDFFAKRDVLEVETPIMCPATVTDPHITSIPAIYQAIGSTQKQTYYLQTSPEYAMKRLLAAGYGSIFQITKAFRQGEIGRLHHPEFTMLEWYRVGFNHHQLMDDMTELFKEVFSIPLVHRKTVQEVFLSYMGIDPHHATVEELIDTAKKKKLWVSGLPHEKNIWLDVLFTQGIEPHLGFDGPVFLYDYPVSQAALAKIRDENPPVASRFEVYFKGIELANGFHELQDAEEQRKRFEKDLAYRRQHDMETVPVDELFLSSLKHGLPDCAGVAMGLDRLLMIMLECEAISDVISFSNYSCTL